MVESREGAHRDGALEVGGQRFGGGAAQRAEAPDYIVVIRGDLVMQALWRVRGRFLCSRTVQRWPSRRHDNAGPYPSIMSTVTPPR
jgi:hypothetical protein